MFVKRVEMFGFKSFADKTVCELTPGVTVVVGPNGCGKSNITDAVRWVLGEQSARHLRGTRMDDIIFGGTANRKPLNFAEVSITLDHADGALGLDFQEVTVTRRLYRSGESEYLLNKRQCRLKDIVELFMDTGIGREAYSFIGQGRVDELLNARPEERRQIFEEAAGILKYKTRKREAERRLAETAENLLRVGDIIHELSGQLAPLEEQAQAARHYLELRDKLRAREVDVFVHDGRELRRRWYDLDEKHRSAADELLQQQAAVGHREAELTAAQLALDEEQSAVAAMQREAQRLNSDLEKVQGRTAVNQEKISSFQRQLAEGESYLGELAELETSLQAETSRVAQLLSEGEKKLSQVQSELQLAQQALKEVETSPEVLRSESCRQELEKLAPELRRLQAEYDRLDVEIEQQRENHQLQIIAGEEKKAALDGLTLQGQALLAQKDGLESERAEQLSRIARNRDVQEEAAKRADSLAVQRRMKEKELTDGQNRLRVLAELEDAMAGYYQGVKSVLSEKKQGKFPGILGTVADLLHVPDNLVAAVEAALGTALQNLVAEDDEVAKEAISWLKKTKGGRATFLPLNILDVQPRRTLPAELAALTGYIGVAADLVGTEERFKQVAESLLSRVHLVANLDVAVPAARLLRFRERVVTLEGDVILPGGAMTGGHDKKQGGVLSRRREAGGVQAAVARLAAELAEMEQSAAKITGEQQDCRNQLTVLEEQLRSLELAIGVKNNEALLLSRQAEAAATALENQARETEALSGRIQEKLAILSRLSENLLLAEEREKSLRVELAGLTGVLSAREQEKRSLQERYTECRVRLASLQQQLEHNQEERERFRREQRQLMSRKTAKEEELQAVNGRLLDLAELQAGGKEEAAALEAERARLLSVLLEREEKLRLKNTRYREETEQLRQLEKSLSGLERKQARLEVERGRVEIELQAILDRLRESWELSFEEAEQLAGEVSERTEAQARIRSLRESIAALGTVNLGAIDEYGRVQERVEFLTVQRDDLREGEKDLLRIIREIDGRMGEKFAAAFTVINETFGGVFKELFGGGRAHLRLTDPENPLEAGIEIVAQPPGKKLQHLSLLSGGEKALTAIALLFAFIKVKPTPFCILDEIEAALDEANLARFTNYLRNLCGETQFIIISHRKKTMEQADILYGVTMEESGVSKMISVRLREAQDRASTA